ncbi:MAG: fused MFS/spermidine synthase, partial [Chloroflexi bacterium]|nr:fused MFS/spermidine synthase [Chloroflexota bacterium]
MVWLIADRNSWLKLRLGVIGLGIGTLAAYGQSGDSFRFYEINPEVVRLARDTGHFSFLADSAAKIEIVEGDGRLSLESELRSDGSQQYDILVLDAFSSDSIPVHLLTLEDFELYVSHLREGGLLAINMATAHLRIAPLVHRVGLEVGLHNVFVL